MSQERTLEYTILQKVVLYIVPFVLIALVWRTLPFKVSLKVFFCCFLTPFLIIIVNSFAIRLEYFNISSSARAAICITAAVFLLAPLIINVVYDVHKRNYLNSYPTDGIISLRITCDVNSINEHGSIGSEWTYQHFLNSQEFKSGNILKVDAKEGFTITSRIIERDGIDDVGEVTSKRYFYSSFNNREKTLTVLQNVHIVENGGRKYSNSSADFEVIYTLKRVIPTSAGFFYVFFYTTSNLDYSICFFLIFIQLICIFAIVYVIIVGNKKKRFKEMEAQHKKEQAFLAEKEAFIVRLKGQSIRQAAGVPAHISFINELPKDNNDAPYGTFTVYCSSSGSCYHDRIGCCSASRPIHYFKAKEKYRACSKCCTQSKSVPQWYIDYISLRKQAIYYKLDTEEKSQ